MGFAIIASSNRVTQLFAKIHFLNNAVDSEKATGDTFSAAISDCSCIYCAAEARSGAVEFCWTAGYKEGVTISHRRIMAGWCALLVAVLVTALRNGESLAKVNS